MFWPKSWVLSQFLLCNLISNSEVFIEFHGVSCEPTNEKPKAYCKQISWTAGTTMMKQYETCPLRLCHAVPTSLYNFHTLHLLLAQRPNVSSIICEMLRQKDKANRQWYEIQHGSPQNLAVSACAIQGKNLCMQYRNIFADALNGSYRDRWIK